MAANSTRHVPVLVKEILEGLAPEPGQIFVDGTAGGGGHLRRFAEAVGANGLALGIDRDPDVIARLEQELSDPSIRVVWGNYANLTEILAENNLGPVDGVLLDLGLSSDQLDDPLRGFSFNIDAPLDLRFNPHAGEPAWRLVQRLSAEHLADLIFRYGEERQSRRIGRAIADARRESPIRTAKQLADVIRRSVGSRYRDRIDPATRTFQALRIAVNGELDNLQTALRRIPESLKLNGRLAVISFHSLEDRMVKEAFRDDERWERITRKPIRPTTTEVLQNPRSRSAKLRIARRVR